MAESKLTKQHENKFSTFMDIETVLDRNNEIVNRIPALSDSVANFKQVIRDITIKAEIKNSVQKGTSETKNVKRFELEEVTMELSSALLALGNKTNNEVIKAIADIPKSALERRSSSFSMAGCASGSAAARRWSHRCTCFSR